MNKRELELLLFFAEDEIKNIKIILKLQEKIASQE